MFHGGKVPWAGQGGERALTGMLHKSVKKGGVKENERTGSVENTIFPT